MFINNLSVINNIIPEEHLALSLDKTLQKIQKHRQTDKLWQELLLFS